MKVARLVIYDGTPEQIQETLARSMSEGVRPGSPIQPSITIVRLPDGWFEYLLSVGVAVFNRMNDPAVALSSLERTERRRGEME